MMVTLRSFIRLLSFALKVTAAVRCSALVLSATATVSSLSDSRSIVTHSFPLSAREYVHSTPTAVTVIVCGAVSSAAKESDVGVISSEAVVVSVSVGLHAAASMHAAATNNIFFIIHLCFRLFFQRRCNVPFNETYPHCGLLSRCTEHDGAVRRDIVDVSVRDNDAVVVVYPLLRTSQVDTRVEVVHPAGGHAESTDADECDAVVGDELSARFAVVLYDDGLFGLGIVECGVVFLVNRQMMPFT